MKRWKNAKQITAWLLTAVMAAALAGCGAGGKTDDGTVSTGTGSAGIDNSQQSTAAADEDVPKGRYVEANIPMPFEDGAERVVNCIERPGGNLELHTLVTGEDGAISMRVYTYDGSGWKETEDPLIAEIPEGRYASYADYGPDGTLYAIYAGDEYKAHLVKISPDRQLQELDVKIGENMVGVNGLHVTENGSILVPESDKLFVISPEGTIAKKLPRAESYSNFNDSHTLTAKSIVIGGEKGFLRYDTEKWEEKEVIPFQSGTSDIYGSLAAGEGEDFYLCNPMGIHHMVENGTMWETVVDGTLNSIGMPSVGISKLFVGPDHDFFLWYKDGENDRMAHYTYDALMASVPSRTLTVYGLNLSSNQTIGQAASLFQLENPDVRVELIDGGQDLGGASKSDTIRALNAELLNGKGADVLVLDGLPYRSYVEKGVLENLKDSIEAMVNSGEIYPNIADSVKEKDGSVYQFPVRISFPILYGEVEAAGSMASIDKIREYHQANSDKPLFAKTVYENILRQMIYLYYPELVSEDTGELIPGQIKKLLETVKTAGEAAGCETRFDDTADHGYGEGYNIVNDRGFTGFSLIQLIDGVIPFALELPESMMDMMYPFSISVQKGYEIQPVNNVYYTRGLLGITSFGKEKETARKFVEFALSAQVQESDLGDGLPVNKKAAAAWQERDSNISMGMSYGEAGEPLYAEYPTPEERKQFMGMIGDMRTPVSVDDVLLEMILNETKGYFEGTQTLEQAVQAVENKAKLYYAE